MATEISPLFETAPPAVQEIAVKIAAGMVPSYAEIVELPDGELNASWAMPEPKDMPSFGHSLLREAVVQRNLPAARALIDAGADIFFNKGEMPFLAAHMVDRQQRRLWFPDYSDGIPFLQLWLENDGSPNVQSPWAGTPLLSDVPHNNLEAVLFLLANGADPWASYVTSVSSTGFEFKSTPYFESRATANSISLEISFRSALEGHYSGAAIDTADALAQIYERTAAQYNESSGPADLAKVWMMQKALPPIFAQLDQSPGPEVAKLLAIDVPEDVGGFWLAPGEIRSPDDENQRPLNDNQQGQQRWESE